jgi:hypothetical protein
MNSAQWREVRRDGRCQLGLAAARLGLTRRASDGSLHGLRG